MLEGSPAMPAASGLAAIWFSSPFWPKKPPSSPRSPWPPSNSPPASAKPVAHPPPQLSARRRLQPPASSRWPPGTPTTTPRPASSSATPNSCATTPPSTLNAAAHPRRLRPSPAASLRPHEHVRAGPLHRRGHGLLDPVKERVRETLARISFPAQARIYAILLANALAFSVLGGALLTRYLLPMYPLVLLVAVSTFHRRVRYWQLLAVFSAAAFLVALFINPPYGFAPEDNLTYAHVIRLHQQAIRQLTARFPGSTVLTAWPVSDELTRPELGYVKAPTEYFGLHRDLTPIEIAKQLEGDIVWRQSDGAEWAAVIRFHRAAPSKLA
jgi:hypothetical protein